MSKIKLFNQLIDICPKDEYVWLSYQEFWRIIKSTDKINNFDRKTEDYVEALKDNLKGCCPICDEKLVKYQLKGQIFYKCENNHGYLITYKNLMKLRSINKFPYNVIYWIYDKLLSN